MRRSAASPSTPAEPCTTHDTMRREAPYANTIASNAREGRLRAHALKPKKGPRGDRIPPRALPASAAARAHEEKRPPRARRPALPQPGAAVLSAKAGLTAGFGMGPGDPRLCGRARGGRSPAAHGYEPARVPFRGDPGGRAAKEATRVSTPRKIPYEDAKSSGYQQRSAERVAPLAPAPCRPGVLPGPLPESGLISETASRLDAFSGYPCRA